MQATTRAKSIGATSLTITPRHKAPRFARVYIAQISMFLFTSIVHHLQEESRSLKVVRAAWT